MNLIENTENKGKIDGYSDRDHYRETRQKGRLKMHKFLLEILIEYILQ